MYYKILEKSEYPIADKFVNSHPNGNFLQISCWQKVKSNWKAEIVAAYDENDKMVGTTQALIQKIFLYCPRGPVCDYDNKEALDTLLDGIMQVAKKYGAIKIKFDPDVPFSNSKLIDYFKSKKFKHIYGPTGFETIQARFNYRLDIKNKTEEDLLYNFTQQCRRNIRLAERNGIVVKEGNIDEFYPLYQTTGKRDGFNIREKAYLQRLLLAFGKDAKLFVAYHENKPLASAISISCSNKYCYVYGASSNEERNLMPNYLLQWTMIKDALKSGAELYDFQGVSTKHPGLLRFKAGFNGYLDELVGEFDKNKLWNIFHMQL